jgi:hypothetical protein
MTFTTIVFIATAAVALRSAALSSPVPTPTPAVCPVAPSRDLRVYLIDEVGTDPRTLDAAKAEAITIWASAGRVLTFATPPIDLTDGRTVIVIIRRGLLSTASGHAAGSDASSPHPLGRINFQAGRPGKLIEVSFQELESVVMPGSFLDRPISALGYGLQKTLLGRGLGRVLAHEIGHWLMGREHTPDGLMKPQFDVWDLIAVDAPRLPRPWTAAGSELLAQSSHCKLDAS